MADRLTVTELDFDTIKENLKTFLKQQAMVRNYNDKSNAGNDFSGSQSAYRAARRY